MKPLVIKCHDSNNSPAHSHWVHLCFNQSAFLPCWSFCVRNILISLCFYYFAFQFNQCSFNKLTERHYEKSPWPDSEYVASIVDGGKLHSFNSQIWSSLIQFCLCDFALSSCILQFSAIVLYCVVCLVWN